MRPGQRNHPAHGSATFHPLFTPRNEVKMKETPWLSTELVAGGLLTVDNNLDSTSFQGFTRLL